MIGSIIYAYLRKLLMTYAIIIANFIVFILSFVFAPDVVADLAFRPIYLLQIEFFPQIYTLFTSIFLHSTYNFLHIIFNTLMFVLIAPHFESRVGRTKFLGIYLITGVFAALFHSLLIPYLPSPTPFDPRIGLIGASGAISGIIGAYAFCYPRDNVFFPVGFIIMKVPILFAGIFFIAIQSLYTLFGGDPGVAYLAHIGGFISGVLISPIFIRTKSKDENETNLFRYAGTKNPIYTSNSKKINFSNLKKLANTNELKDLLNQIEKENVTEVRDAWLDHFLEKVNCPKCGKKLNHSNNKIWCEENHFNTNY
jgi:membrane associated rhomboid family serine protease